MKVEEVMTREVVTVRPLASLKEVAALLVEHGVSGLPVVDEERRPLGVVSEAEILLKERTPARRSRVYTALHPGGVLEEDRRHSARTAAEAMTAPALTIAPGRPVAEAAARLLDDRVHRLVVVEEGRVVGIVTRADLVRAFARGDREIEREIRERVLLEGMWIDPCRVTVAVRDGHVTLRGGVDTQTNAELLPSFVDRVPGVVSVDAELRWSR